MGKGARQKSARERLAEERKRQAQRALRMKILTITLGSVVAAALIVVAVVVIIDQRGKSDTKGVTYTGAAAPVTRDADGSIVYAKQGVTGPVLELFEDFQCPACKRFEAERGDTVMKLAAEGKAKVIFRPYQLFNTKEQQPATSNSLRAGNAALCTPADKWASYSKTLFKNQPEETEDGGFANKDLINWAKDLGFGNSEFEKCVKDKQKKSVLDKGTQFGSTKGVKSTPSLFINGQLLNEQQMNVVMSSADGLQQLLAAAAKASPSPTPTKKQ